MNLKSTSLLLASTLAASPVMADELVVTLVSKHWGTDTKFQEVNPGLMYKHSLHENYGLVAGGYLNSLDRFSALLGGYLEGSYQIPSTNAQIGLGAVSGLLTGYNLDIPVGISPYVYLEANNVRAYVNVMPVVERDGLSGLATGFSLGVKF